MWHINEPCVLLIKRNRKNIYSTKPLVVKHMWPDCMFYFKLFKPKIESAIFDHFVHVTF